MIPTILLTGFLGAGKTTLLNRLIAHYGSRRLAVLVNEFGQAGIDGQLLRQGDYQLVQLNRGSLFCICVRTDFIAEVERIARQLEPELLLIEATGLADTSEMEKMLALPTLRVRATAGLRVPGGLPDLLEDQRRAQGAGDASEERRFSAGQQVRHSHRRTG